MNITGYSKPAVLVTPAPIDAAHSAAVDAGKYVAILQQYPHWWQFQCEDSEMLSRLPLGISEWFETLPDDIKARSCIYVCPFSIGVDWVRTHTRIGTEYRKPYWETTKLHAGVISLNNQYGQRCHITVQFSDGETYRLGKHAAYATTGARQMPGNLIGAMVYNPKASGESSYWMSARMLETTFNSELVLYDDRESTNRFLNMINDLCLPVLHMHNVVLRRKTDIGGRIKECRTQLLKGYHAIYETARAHNNLAMLMPVLSVFQKDAIATLSSAINKPGAAFGEFQMCEGVLDLLRKMVLDLISLDEVFAAMCDKREQRKDAV